MAATKEKPTAETLTFKNDKQRELMRVILKDFLEYTKRDAHYYLGNGMSTSHIVVHALLQDFTTLAVFWPPELVHPRIGGVTYELADDVMRRAQNDVRKTLDELTKLGYIEKIGNTDERRWRPVRSLKGATL